MLAPYIIGTIVVTIGLLLIFLRETTELVNFRYGGVELTLPAGFFLVIIGIVITLFPIGVQYFDTKNFDPSRNSPTSTMQTAPENAGPNAPIHASQNPTPFPIEIDPVNIPIPCRVTFTGTGDVPSDRTLWLVIQRISTPPKYYPKPVIVNAVDHKWIAANVIVGTKDTLADSRYVIYAVLVDDATNQRLKQRNSKDWLEEHPGQPGRSDTGLTKR